MAVQELNRAGGGCAPVHSAAIHTGARTRQTCLGQYDSAEAELESRIEMGTLGNAGRAVYSAFRTAFDYSANCYRVKMVVRTKQYIRAQLIRRHQRRHKSMILFYIFDDRTQIGIKSNGKFIMLQ